MADNSWAGIGGDQGAVDDSQSPTWGDYGTALTSGLHDLQNAGFALGRYMAEREGNKTGTELYSALEDQSRDEEAQSVAGMSQAGRDRLQAAFTDPAFYSHPLSASLLKATRMSPALLAAMIPGGAAADAAGATIGVAGVMGAQQSGAFLDDFYNRVDNMSDADLQKDSTLYRGLRTMSDEQTARQQYDQQLLGAKPVINFLAGAATGLLGPAAGFARGMTGEGASALVNLGEGRLASAASSALEGGVASGAGAGIQDATLQAALQQGGLQKDFDPNELANSILESTVMGAVPGAAMGAIFHSGARGAPKDKATPAVSDEEADTRTAAQSAPPKSMGTGSIGPVNENVNVGNPQSAPTRDQGPGPKPKDYAKNKQPGAGAKVTQVDVASPDTDQAAAIAANTKQDAAPVEQVAQVTQKVTPQPQPTQPVVGQAPVIREAGEPAPAPTSAPAVQVPSSGLAEAHPPVTQLQPAREAPTPVDAVQNGRPATTAETAPRPEQQTAPAATPAAEATPPGGARRVLRSQREQTDLEAELGADAADKNSQSIAADQKRQAKNERVQALVQGENVETKSHKSAAVEAKRAADAQAAKDIFENNPAETLQVPQTPAERAALADRLNGVLDQADKAGIKIPTKIYDTTPDHLMWLREVQTLANKMKQKSFVGERASQHMTEYLFREAAARMDDFQTMRDARKVEGDSAKRATAGKDTSNIAAPEEKPAEALDEAAAPIAEAAKREETQDRAANVSKSGAGSVRGIGDGTETTDKGQTRARAASGDKLTPDAKAKMIAERNAELAAQSKATTQKKIADIKDKAKPEPKPETLKDKVEVAANEADSNPTPAQKEAGNYQKGHVNFHGLDISIENPKGSMRRGLGPDGEPWSVKMPYHYGYDRGTTGMDGDDVDVGIGDHPENSDVLLVNQVHPDTKAPDEHKALMGFANGAQALDAYERGFSDGRGMDRIGSITPMSMDQYKAWRDTRGATKKPTDEAGAPITSELRQGGPKLTSPNGETVTPQFTMKAREALRGLDLGNLTRIPKVMATFMREKLEHLAGDTPVHILSGEDMARFRGTDVTSGLHQLFPNGESHILLRSDRLENPNDAAHIVLHEVSHEVVNRALLEDVGLHNDVASIMREVHENLQQFDNPAFDYAMTNPREFMAEAFSNPAMQDALAQMPASRALMSRFPGGGERSMWHIVTDIVRRVIERIVGPLPQAHSMIDAVMRVGDKFEQRKLADNAADKAQGPRKVMAHEAAQREFAQLRSALDSHLKMSRDTLSNVGDTIRNLAGNPDAKPLLKRFANAITTNDQLRQRAGDMAEHAKTVFDMLNKQGTLAQTFKKGGIRLVADLMRAARKSPEVFKRFAALVNEQTMYGVDASARIGEGRNGWLGLSKDNLARQAKGKLRPHDLPMTQWEAHAAHPKLAAEYRDIVKQNPDLAPLQERLFSFFHESQAEMAKGHVDNYLRAASVSDADRPSKVTDIMNTKPTADFKEKLAADYGDVVAKQILDAKKLTGSEGPYSPLMRHGDFVVGAKYKVKDPANAVQKVGDNAWEFKTRQEAHDFAQSTGLHYGVDTVYYDKNTGKRTTKEGGLSITGGSPEQRYEVKVQRDHVEFHESEREARAAAKQLHETGEFENAPYVEARRDYIGRGQEIGNGALDTMRRKLAQTDAYRRAAPAQQAEWMKSLEEAALVTQAGNRIQSRRIPRRRVAGASEDLLRNLDSYNTSQANYRAKLEYRPQIEDALADMHQDVLDKRYTGDTLRRSELANEIEKRARAEDPNETGGGMTQWMRRAATWSYIDRMMRPSHLILHQTHLPMITAPTIAGRHGALSTYTEMMRTWRQATSAYRAGAIDTKASIADSLHEGTDFQRLMKQNFARSQDGARIGQMLDHLAEIGVIHPQAGIEVAKYAPHNRGTGLVGHLDGFLAKMDTVFRHATNATEAINRYVGAVMAYRLEFAKQTAKGIDADKAHDLATNYARDTVANTQGFYTHTNAAPLFKNRILRPFLQFKQFPQMMYHLLISNAVRAFKGATKEEKIQAAASLMGVLAAHTVMTGLLGGLPLEAFKIGGLITKGLGITNNDWSDFERWQYEQAVDMFGQQGADLVMHGLARHMFGVDLHHRLGLNSFFTFGLPTKIDKKDISTFILDQALGAPEGLAEDTLTGINHMMNGDLIGGATLALPSQALRDQTRAWYYGGSPSGKYTYSAPQRFARALGFTPTGEAQRGERAAEMSQEKGEYNDMRSTLIKNWVQASPSDKGAAFVAIQKFNAGYPAAARITMAQLQSSAARQKTAAQTGRNYMGVSINKQTQWVADRDKTLYGAS